MAITYSQKRALVRQIADPASWRNDYDRAHELMLSRYFHAVSIDPGKNYGIGSIPRADLLEVTKLLIARDFAIERDLSSFNGLSAHAVANLKNKIEDESMIFGDAFAAQNNTITSLDALEKSCDDSADFEGCTGIPRSFLVEDTKDALTVHVSLGAREQIWAQGQIFNQAMGGAPARKHGLQQQAMDTLRLLNLLSDGVAINDHRQNQWMYIVLEWSEQRIPGPSVQDILWSQLKLEGHQAMALRFKQDRILVAMEVRTLLYLHRAVEASITLHRGIVDGSIGPEKVLALLEDGADIKFIHPERPQYGQTFASLARSHERYDVLRTLRDWKGVHDLSHEATQPVHAYCAPLQKREYG